MNITIISCGQMRDHSQRAYLESYTKRMTWSLSIKEVVVASSKKTPSSLTKKTEADSIKKFIPDSAYVIALDEHGLNLTSTEFAKELEKIRDISTFTSIAFIIGGAHGLDHSILEMAHKKIALGAMTWPHIMVRIMLCEQIYRAQQILSGHPYHKQ